MLIGLLRHVSAADSTSKYSLPSATAARFSIQLFRVSGVSRLKIAASGPSRSPCCPSRRAGGSPR